ncbi:unnamed protein product [Psylliodes chrysocephalus]|uniref:Uncharacterized protein n=1 Tax=Psylliodes chrysocephalus TaxID=3402493 RepID=A0A9P0CI78_9CUCU|nr:unnamed protein product [Psylliodes chrysocephala]
MRKLQKQIEKFLCDNQNENSSSDRDIQSARNMPELVDVHAENAHKNENMNSQRTAANSSGVADDTELLNFMGEDSSMILKKGNPVHEGIVSRLKHIFTKALEKDNKEEILTKYPPPIIFNYIL